MRRDRFIVDGAGLRAIDRAAWQASGGYFDVLEAPPSFTTVGNVAIVTVCGPLTNARHWLWDSYEAIRERVGEALSSSARAVVLHLNTPGGLAQGNVETARAIREAATKSGKPLVAFVDGMACSAGYALACAANEVVVAPTGVLGSIGSLIERVDASENLAQSGVKVAVIASGERKADGDPSQPLSDGERAAMQTLVDDFAGLFFSWVAEARPALNVERVRGLQAGIFLGERARAEGLADRVGSLDSVLAAYSAGAVPLTPTPARSTRRLPNGVRSMDKAQICKWLGLPEDASDADVMKALEGKLAPQGEGDKPAEDKAAAEEAKSLAAKLAAESTARGELAKVVSELRAEVEAARPIVEAHRTREREDAVDAEMAAKGMPTHAQRDGKRVPTEAREKFQALAREHGLAAAKASIAAAHVPPTGEPIVKPLTAEKRGETPPEGAPVDVLDQGEATKRASAAVRAEQPTLSGPAFHRAVLERARKDFPKAFSRAAAAGRSN